MAVRSIAGTRKVVAAIKTERRKRIAESKYLYVMLSLPILYFILFKYGPMFGLLIGFQDYNFVKGVFHSEWVGLRHFREFLSDPYFWRLVKTRWFSMCICSYFISPPRLFWH